METDWKKPAEKQKLDAAKISEMVFNKLTLEFLELLDNSQGLINVIRLIIRDSMLK